MHPFAVYPADWPDKDKRKAPRLVPRDDGGKLSWTNPDDCARSVEAYPEGPFGLRPADGRAVVLDVDLEPDKGCFTNIEAIRPLRDAAALEYRTPSGGLHLWYQWKGDTIPQGNWRLKTDKATPETWRRGETRHEDGYVVLWDMGAFPPTEPGKPPPLDLLDIKVRRPTAKPRRPAPVPTPAPATGIAKRVETWADKAIADLAATPKGNRNNRLNEVTYAVAQRCAAHPEADRRGLCARIREAALATGMKTGEIRTAMTSGWRAGLQVPQPLEDRDPPTPREQRAKAWREGARRTTLAREVYAAVRDGHEKKLAGIVQKARAAGLEPTMIAPVVVNAADRADTAWRRQTGVYTPPRRAPMKIEFKTPANRAGDAPRCVIIEGVEYQEVIQPAGGAD
ncbi:MAG: bifunctional DNA primase/polymerase [Gemmatimonadota bacterium]|nr:bifunctional DNA primase/polymerase [Gemmatimonadota bacterium]